jgi:hypothetical protein
MKHVLMFLALSLAVACGQAPQPSQDSSILTPAALTPDPCATAPCSWNNLGPQPLNPPPGFLDVNPSLTVAQTLPMVAWREFKPAAHSEVLVRVKTGPTWEAPTRLNDVGDGFSVTFAQASVSTLAPVVAFQEVRPNVNSVIRLKIRTVVNGASVWKPFDPQSGAGLSAGGLAFSPSVVTTPDNTFVAWAEGNPNNRETSIFVQVFKNGVWRNLGTRPDGSVDSGTSPRLAVNANNRMALAYLQPTAVANRVVVRRWGGTTFDLLPDPSTPNILGVTSMALTVANTGEPIVALQERTNTVSQLVVRQRTGHGTWLQLGLAVVDTNGHNPAPSLAVAGDQISLAYNDDQNFRALVKRWNPATQTWIPFGDAINSSGRSFSAEIPIALDASGNPLAAINQQDVVKQRTDLLVRKWGVPGGLASSSAVVHP